MKQTKYDVFISYSRKDYVDEHKNVIPGNKVSKIKEALSQANITYWFDEEGIYSGQNFVEKIVTNIENAKIFLFLSTVNANKSPWTCKEIASADEFKKHIIPVRIDASPYNKKVLFRIADLDYIEYYTNPQKGIEDLIKAVRTYLDELAEEERRKKEEEIKKKEVEREKEEKLRKQREQEEKRRQEEQERVVAEIKSLCAMLNNEEAKIEIDRSNLFLKAEGVHDISQRTVLIDLIKAGGTIHQKYQKEYSELIEKYEKLKLAYQESLAETKEQTERIQWLRSNLEALKAHEEEERGQNEDLRKRLNVLQKNGSNKKGWRTLIRTHVPYWIIILIVLICAIISWRDIEYWKSRGADLHVQLLESALSKKDLDDQLRELAELYLPFVLTRINMSVTNFRRDSAVISNIGYVGLKTGRYPLELKLYKITNGFDEYLSSYTYEVSINEGYNNVILYFFYGEYGESETYRMEAWYKEKKMEEKIFKIEKESERKSVEKMSDIKFE